MTNYSDLVCSYRRKIHRNWVETGPGAYLLRVNAFDLSQTQGAGLLLSPPPIALSDPLSGLVRLSGHLFPIRKLTRPQPHVRPDLPDLPHQLDAVAARGQIGADMAERLCPSPSIPLGHWPVLNKLRQGSSFAANYTRRNLGMGAITGT